MVGGLNYLEKVLPFTEVYQISTNQWAELPNLNKERKNAGLIIIEDTLYTVGGLSLTKPLRSIEKLQLSAVHLKWVLLSFYMDIPLAYPTLIQTGNTEFAILGGLTERNQKSKRVFFFNNGKLRESSSLEWPCYSVLPGKLFTLKLGGKAICLISEGKMGKSNEALWYDL